ncbi:MAG: pyridoxamine 5'-phosphate oxidase family protein [Acidimicrobiales bacterium]
MSTLDETAPAFIEIAHRIVWCTAATVDPDGRPRTRILHPIWQWDGGSLIGWIATGPTPVKSAALDIMPAMSVSYWDSTHDTVSADCDVTWHDDLETCTTVWNLFAEGPEPVGYDPSIIPGWDGPDSLGFRALRLDPYRVRVFPGTMLLSGSGKVHHWRR